MKQAFGTETEFAIAPLPTGDRGAAASVLDDWPLDRVVSAVARQHPHLRALGHGVFLGNGGRLYVDGSHVEYATPETTTPTDAVNHVLAGERLLQQGIGAAGRRPSHRLCPPLTGFKNNVDYNDPPTTYGCHENYSHRSSHRQLAAHLVAFLCSRLVFTGMGGFDATRPLRFCLSPRTPFLNDGDQYRGRAIFNTRDEPLTDGSYRRLHLICGESQCSHLGMLLKYGTTAIAVAMADANVGPDDATRPVNPCAAMKRFAADPTCRARVATRSGGTATALEIQQAYLRCAMEHVRARWMPPWAERIIDAWQDVLQRLADGPAAVADRLDWAIKYVLFEDYCARRGFAFSDLPQWDEMLKRLKPAAQRRGLRLEPSDATNILRCGGAVRRVLEPHALFEPRDRRWERLEEMLRLRYELFEIDLRYAQLGPGSVFAGLDAAGALNHRVEGVGDQQSERAMTQPPQDTRARTRGKVIMRLVQEGRGDDYRSDWDGIYCPSEQRALDLGDLFAESPRWRPSRGRHMDLAHMLHRSRQAPRHERALHTLIDGYSHGRWARVKLPMLRLRHGLQRMGADAAGSQPIDELLFRVNRYCAWITARLGGADALRYIDENHRGNSPLRRAEMLTDYLFVYRHTGLQVPADACVHVHEAEETLRLRNHRGAPDLAEPVGYYYLRRGQLLRARVLLEDLDGRGTPLRELRTRLALVDVFRLMNMQATARGVLGQMKASAYSNRMGLYAEYVLIAEAKLADRRRDRQQAFRQAQRINQRTRNRRAALYTLLLQARGCRDRQAAARFREQIENVCLRVRSMRDCPRRQQITGAGWEDWTMSNAPDESGDYWWGI